MRIMNQKTEINAILSMDKNGCIGKDGSLAVTNNEDMQFFRRMTRDSYVIMGRKTWESLKRPLVNRVNVIVSRELYEANKYSNFRESCVQYCESLDDAFNYVENDHTYNKAFIIGGAQIYNTVFTGYNNKLDNIYVTEYYDLDVNGDTYIRKDIIENNFYRESKIKFMYVNTTVNTDTNNSYGTIWKYCGKVLNIVANPDASLSIHLKTTVEEILSKIDEYDYDKITSSEYKHEICMKKIARLFCYENIANETIYELFYFADAIHILIDPKITTEELRIDHNSIFGGDGYGGCSFTTLYLTTKEDITRIASQSRFNDKIIIKMYR